MYRFERWTFKKTVSVVILQTIVFKFSRIHFTAMIHTVP